MHTRVNTFKLVLSAIISSLTSSTLHIECSIKYKLSQFLPVSKQAEVTRALTSQIQLFIYDSAPINMGGVMGNCGTTNLVYSIHIISRFESFLHVLCGISFDLSNLTDNLYHLLKIYSKYFNRKRNIECCNVLAIVFSFVFVTHPC